MEDTKECKNVSRTCEPTRAETVQPRSPDVHNRKIQLLALQQRYREADEYHRPGIRLLIQMQINPHS